MNASQMSYTIVVPLYNKADYIGQTIASLAMQQAPPDELIVVDDASTDGSLACAREALAEHAQALARTRIEIIASAENGGPGAARNRGLDAATCELVGFLDADDGYRPDALRRIRQAMAEHALDIAAIGFESEPPGERFPQRAQIEGGIVELAPDLWRLLEPLHTVSGEHFFMGRASNVVVRRAWLNGLRYDTAARLNEGIDFWYRVLKHLLAHTAQARVGVFAASLIRFRLLPDSLSHRICDDWRSLPPPPSVLRYLGSEDPHDRRLVRTLAERWLEHAMAALTSAAQRAAFVQAHRPLLLRTGLDAASLDASTA